MVVSCQLFEKKVPSEKELFEKRMKEINWKEVDEFPSINECESIKDEQHRKQCFFEFLTNSLQQKFSEDSFSKLFPKVDTIQVKVTVMPDASLLFEPQFSKDSLAYNAVKIDSILHARLVDFPKINPAIKRGIPVKTQFILPVVINQK